MSLQDGSKAGVAIVRRLIPPTDGDPWSRFRYDAAVSGSLLIGGAFVAFHVLWVCGLLTFIGITAPFASADEMHTYEQRLVNVQQAQLDAQLRDAKTKICLAIQAKNQAALEAWARELEGLKSIYRNALGREPYVMGCDELLIGGTAQQ